MGLVPAALNACPATVIHAISSALTPVRGVDTLYSRFHFAKAEQLAAQVVQGGDPQLEKKDAREKRKRSKHETWGGFSIIFAPEFVDSSQLIRSDWIKCGSNTRFISISSQFNSNNENNSNHYLNSLVIHNKKYKTLITNVR